MAAAVAGTRTDLAALVGTSRAAGLDVTLGWEGDDVTDADPRVRQAMHRTVREGLANVHKHAATTPAVRVSVVVGGGRAGVVVHNDPPRARTAGPGTAMGLIGLHQRAALLGGTCRGRDVRGGFALTLDVPLAPPDRSPGQDSRAGPSGADPEDDLLAPGAPDVMTAPRVAAVIAVAVLIVVPVVAAMIAVLEQVGP